ncbi:8489_t:CDS:2 [Paraglomus occultum]|uniref:8489_t:CDS:1 n=1 Tax=Paraglomus occultum TaxID=144539 RepID=A0A9N8ZGR3_9GLOM|nr:8489_t:CDS:2 [Paraglomus occultum]
MQLIRQVLERTETENENEKDLKTIIETHGFTPFPPSPTFRTYIFENFDESEDDLFPGGYATASDLKIIAKVIINHQHLPLTIWKKMGYHEIIADLENAVVQLTLLELYSTDTDDADKLRDADTILDEYYAANVPFDPSLLSLFKKCLRTKPISYLFEGYLANLFGSEIQRLFLTAIPIEVDALVSPTQTIELKQRWLGEIQKSIQSDEFMSDGFIRQAIDFLTLYNLS